MSDKDNFISIDMSTQQDSNSSINNDDIDVGSFITINAFLFFEEEFKKIREKRFSNFKPWSDFFDRFRISKPKDFSDITKRISHNIIYFQANYLIIFLVLLIYIMITNLLLLASVVFIGTGFYYVSKLTSNEPTFFFGNTFAVNQKKLYVILGILSVILFYLSSGGSAFFWIFGMSSTIILSHASLIEPSIEYEFVSTV